MILLDQWYTCGSSCTGLKHLTHLEKCITRKDLFNHTLDQVVTITEQKIEKLNFSCCFRMQRIPASWLSIHRLQSSTFSGMCQTLSFPLYKVSFDVNASICCNKSEISFFFVDFPKATLYMHVIPWVMSV